jgi:hypothetical protein
MRIDLTGRKFGRLTVMSLSPKSDERRTYWLCQCECGSACEPRADALKPEAGSGVAHSCGCLQRDKVCEKGVKSTSKRPTFSAQELRDLLTYIPDTGAFIWREGQRSGRDAGTIEAEGYRTITIHGRQYKAHLLAWYYTTGEWPENQVDHRDNDRANNRWENLRAATNRENQFNKGPNKNNRSGFKGVYLSTSNRRRPWKAKISVYGKNVHLGYFDTAEAAQNAYLAMAVQLSGEFASIGSN